MRTPVIDRQSIEQFIPLELMREFYYNSLPKYKYTISNGLDPYGFSTNGLVLYLPLWALKGSSFKSVDAYKTTATVSGATWTPTGRDFNRATPDYIDIPATATQLDFTSGAFSIVARITGGSLADWETVFTKGTLNMNGYLFIITNTGVISLYTSQAAANQVSNSGAGEIVDGVDYTIGCSRSGTSVVIYKNGVDVTSSSGTHTNPVTAATDIATIGTYINHSSNPFDGIMGDFLIYNRALPVGEHLDIHNRLSWRT